MKRVLVLHDDKSVRERLNNILVASGYQVVVCDSLGMFEKIENSVFDLYLCGQLGKYSDGLISALDLHDSGKKVIIVGKKKKFSKIPFMNTQGMTNPQIEAMVKNHLAEG
jgi:DNA-binding NtrC family response regulator